MSKPADKPLISDTAKEDHTHKNKKISCVKVEETSCLEDIFRAKTPIIIGEFSYEWATRSEFPRNTTETRLTRTLKNLCRIKYFWKRCSRCVKLQMKSYERGLTANRRCKKHKSPKAINRKKTIKSEPKIEMYEGSENKSIVNNNKDVEQSYHIESSVQLLDNDAPYLPKLLTIEVDSDISEIENRTSNINEIIEHKKVKVEQDCINSDTIKEFLQNIVDVSKEAGSAEDGEVARLKVRSQEYLFGSSEGLPLINNDCGYDDIVNFLFPNSEKNDDLERSITKKSTESEYEKTHFDFFLELLSGHTVISDTQNISIDENSKNSIDLSGKTTGDQSGISVLTDDMTSALCSDDSANLIAVQNKEFSKDKQVTETELKRKEAEVPQQTVQRKSIKQTALKSMRINPSSNDKATLEDSQNVKQEANTLNTNMLNTSESKIKTEPVESTVAAVHIPTTHTANSTINQTHSHPSTIASDNTVSTNNQKKPHGLTYSKSAYSNSSVLANNLSINSPLERSHQRQVIPENATMPRMAPQTFSNYPKQPLLGCSPVNHQQSDAHVGNLAQKQSLNRSFGVPSPRQSPQVAQVANMNLPSPQLPPEQNNTMRQMLENFHNSSVPTTLSSNHQVNPKDQTSRYCPSEWTPLETDPLISIESSAYSTQSYPPPGQATPHRGVPHQSSKTSSNLLELLNKPMNNFSSNAPKKDADRMRLPVKRNVSVVQHMINDNSLRKTAKTHNNLIDSQSLFTGAGQTSTHEILGQNAKKIPIVKQQSNQMNNSMNPNAPKNPTGQQQIFRKTLNNPTAPSHASPNHSANQILIQNKTTAPQRIINNSADNALRQRAKIYIKNPAVTHIVSGIRMNQPAYHQILRHNTKKTPTVDQVNLMHYLNQGHTQNAPKNPTGPRQILNQQSYSSTDNTLPQIARLTDTLAAPYFLSMDQLNSSNNLILIHNHKNSTGPQFDNNLTGAQFQGNISVSQYQNTTGPQFPNITTLPHQHNITGPQFHNNPPGSQFHDNTGSHVHNHSTGPQFHKNTTLTQFHNTNLPQFHNNTTLTQFHNTILPQFHNTTGPQLHNTNLPQFHNTTGPQLLNTTLPQFHNTTGPHLHNNTGPHLHNNPSGPHLQNNPTGPQLHNNSVGPQFHKHSTGTQLRNNSTTAQSHNTIGPQFHKNISGSQYHNTTGTQVHNNPTGPQLHNNSTGPQLHNNSTVPQPHNTIGPQFHNTTGTQCYNNPTGTQSHNNSTAPQSHNIIGSQYHKNSSGLQYNNNAGPQFHNSTTPQLHNSTGLQLHNTTGTQFHKNSHDPQQIFVRNNQMYNFTGD